MAKDSTVNEAANQINQAISNASNATSDNLSDLGNAITGAVNDLGEGLKLTAKKEEKLTKEPADYSQLVAQLQGLRVLIPEMAEAIDLLIQINTNTLDSSAAGQLLLEKTTESTEKEPEEEEPNINTSAAEVSELNGLTTLTEITGTGFSILGNILQGLSELFMTALSGITAQDLQAALVSSNVTVTASEKAEEAAQSEQEGPTKGVLASFFQQLAGPLESIAGGLLLLSISLAILNTLQIDAQLLGTMVIMQALFLTMFGMVALISAAFQNVAQYFDAEGENQGSILFIAKAFAGMVAMVAGAFLLCSQLVEVIQEHWQDILLGLVLIFGTAFVTLVGLSVLASSMGEMVGENSAISKMITSFAKMVMLVAGLAIFCWLLYPIIAEGMQYAAIILAMTLGMMIGLVAIIANTTATAEQLEAFSKILTITTVIIGIIAVLTIVLGLIPSDIITQGLIAVGLIVVLVDSLIFMLGNAIQKVANVSAEQLQMLMGILIVTTVMIGILSILVYALGSIEVSVLVQGLIAVTLITAIPIVLLKVMSKIGQSAATQLPQALLGVLAASLLTVAVTAVAWLIVSAFQNFTIANVMTTVLAISLTTVMLIAMGLVGPVLAGISTPLVASLPMALLGIGAAGILALAISGVALLIGTILNTERAQAALNAAGAIILTTAALLVVSGGALVLAAMAIPLTLSVGLALIALRVLSNFLVSFAEITASAMTIVAETFASVSTEGLQVAVATIATVIESLISLSGVLFAFNAIAWTLVAQLVFANAAMILTVAGLSAISINLRLLDLVLSTIPEGSVDLTPITEAVEGLNEVSATINSFQAPNLASMVGLMFTLNFVTGFANRLGKIIKDESISKVKALAESLSELASNAGGLQNLAAALESVADATAKLNDVSTDSKVSIEALSGKVDDVTRAAELEQREPVQDDTKMDQVLEQLMEAVAVLKGLSENIQRMTASTAKISEVQDLMSRQPRSAFMQS